jgi:hypothetical protein
MKKVFYLVFLVLFAFSCKETSTYIINGDVAKSELERSVVQLFSVDSIGNDLLVSVDTIRENKFSFTGKANSGLAYIEIENQTELVPYV